MKKLLLSLGVVAASVSASAATGNYFISGQFNNWNHAQLQFEQSGTEYSITLDGTGLQPFSNEFLICGGTKGKPDWNDKIGGVSNMVADKEYTYIVGGGNMSVSGIIAYPLTIKFNTSTKKIEITGATAENDYDTVYLIGDFGNGWSETNTNYPLQLKSGTNNVWEGDYTFTNSKNYFKLKAGAYVYSTGSGDINVVSGTTYTAPQSGSAFVVTNGTYHFEFVLDKNADTGELTVTGDGETPEIDYSTWYVNVVGPFNDWTDNGVHPNAEGVATLENLAIGNQGFKVKIWNGNAIYYCNNDPIVAGEPTVLYQDEFDITPMTIVGSQEGDKYNVTFDCASNTVTVTKVGGDDPNPPTPVIDYTTWYVNVVGPFNGWADNGVHPNAEGVATLENLAIGIQGFKVKIWNGNDIYYCNNDPIVPGEPTVLYQDIYNIDPMTIEGAQAGDIFNAIFDCVSNTMTVVKVGGEEVGNGATFTNKEAGVVEQEGNTYSYTAEYKVTWNEDRTLTINGTITFEDGAPYGIPSHAYIIIDGIEKQVDLTSVTRAASDYSFTYTTEEKYNAEQEVNIETKMEYGLGSLTNDFKYVTGSDKVTSIAEVVMIDEATVYFNLQGVKVANPENGIYVKVANGKASKVVIK